MQLPENIQLIEALRNSDQKIFQDLYDHYSEAIFNNIYKLIPQRDDAHDILQSVFLQLWESRLKLKEEQSVAGWLFTTSFYLSMTHLRSVARSRLKVLEDDLEVADNTYNDSTGELYTQKMALLNKAINELPSRKKMAFELCKIEGKTYKEAASILGIAEDTVKEYVKSATSTVKRYVMQTDLSMYMFLLVFLS
ncbi:sigma-70 family RNA polymerase sigma factor [Terrimonas sp. NA20]|uniref:Sigma-70 family RNA polymerase sigma factor n=1 Tax=Terrimonas ginsenosidimutans TaxID=2908004 RepID=A0ABS9KYX4_9BACT|nr:sigma-70 family RNA polymerase sigma factor [Terrimonas ginsenosidimutans]MCG2617491.1 sigma-70 family RNA polymerase sigma factor [Terrimonas ginsenosidimutans]